MNPIVLYFASGESLYSGAALLLLTIAVSPFVKQRWFLRLRNVVALIALAMIIMASPPFSWIVDSISLFTFLFWFIAWNRSVATRWSTPQAVSGGTLVLLLLVLSAMEFSHRKLPILLGPPQDHIVVIGGSISAGVGTRVAPWPAVMQQMTGATIKNLSQPGATVIEGQTLVAKLTPEDRFVLIEIGGNDLLGDEPPSLFAQGLESILAKATAAGRTVAMFELPLLPERIEFGQIQRRLAAKYKVGLIPKRFLTDVISGRDATSDGLHLTDVGARRMALLVTQVFAPVLIVRRDATTPATHL